jgi:glycerol kinase
MAILSLDAGTTGVTALVVGSDTRVLARGYAEFPQHFPADGWVEHDPGEIWSATLAATGAALAASPESISAVGITNQRETVCFWDRETLGSARKAIVWQDRRTAAQCEHLREAGYEDVIRARTGLRLDPYFTATKIAWVRDHDPDTWAQVESGRVAIGTVDSYLIARMTRGLHHITDHTNASRTLVYDLESGEFSTELADIFGIPLQAMPAIVPSYGPVATTDPATFLGMEVPIAGIAGDQQAALIGQAGFGIGDAKCTYGTGSFLLVNTGENIVRSAGGLLTTVALGAPDGTRTFALEGAIFVTGSAVQWLRDGLGIIASAGDVEALARTVDDSAGVVFVPALTGLGAPDWDPYARGLIIGINRGTTSGHIARATLEGIAFEVADVVDLMINDAKVSSSQRVSLNQLNVDGGAAANDLLCHIQADLLGVPVVRPRELQSTGIGAAFLAGLGTGVWSGPGDIAASRVVDRSFSPRPERAPDRAKWRAAVERSHGWADPNAGGPLP